jgi:F420-non-reducing hydrogenase iron-sulfur subunit
MTESITSVQAPAAGPAALSVAAPAAASCPTAAPTTAPATAPSPTAAAAGPAPTTFEPRVVGILCNWCSYAGADKAGAAGAEYPANVGIVRVMCSGRVDPQFVLTAFAKGADGVLILGCHPGDCHYKEQNYRAAQRHRLVLRVLGQFGVDERRCRFGYISAAEGQEFAATIREFVDDLRALGPIDRIGSEDVGPVPAGFDEARAGS